MDIQGLITASNAYQAINPLLYADDPHAISELYQHFLTAGVVLGPILSALGIVTFLGWKISWNLSRRLVQIDYKISVMWKAFCKQHNIDTNGDTDRRKENM